MKHRDEHSSRLVSRLFFRLLPAQILLCLIGAVNGVVSSIFASNFVGPEAMSAVGLYQPVQLLLTCVSTVLVSGSQLICGKFMGRNEYERTQGVFTVSQLVALFFSLGMILLLLLSSFTGATSLLGADASNQAILHAYILGQCIGILPLMLSAQLSAFLSLENQNRRTQTASLIYIAVNLGLNALFVAVLKLGAFGLSLASSLGLWVFLAIQAEYFLSPKSTLRYSKKYLRWKDGLEIVRVGYPGALNSGYQTIRGILVNQTIVAFVGTVGLSAMTAANSFLSFFWTIPGGMLNVSRILMGIYIGEEDRQSLTDVMRNAFCRCVPIMCGVSALLMLLAEPLTGLYYRDAATPLYRMTVMGFRLLPLGMPLAIFCMHFTCYAQASKKDVLVHVLSLLDGVICVAGFSALLTPRMGLNGVYLANVLNGIICALVPMGYAWALRRRFPRTMDEVMLIPADFGVPPADRLDLSVLDMTGVVSVSRQVISFCQERGIDARRAYFAGLALEEMAGNAVLHGFTKDKKSHALDIRVSRKGEDLILRVKDDCIPFNPADRLSLFDPKDPVKNMGIRMVYGMAKDVTHQNMLGLNVLTIRI